MVLTLDMMRTFALYFDGKYSDMRVKLSIGKQIAGIQSSGLKGIFSANRFPPQENSTDVQKAIRTKLLWREKINQES